MIMKHQTNVHHRCPSIIMVAGTSSGVGKTTLTCGIMAALTRRGLNVAPFKVGPDFLDAMHHEASIEAAVGASKRNLVSKRRKRKTINLDGWMMGGEKSVLDCFLRHCGRLKDAKNDDIDDDDIDDDDDDDDEEVDVCIIEGCMGLYDSKNGTSDSGSSAQIAKIVNASVVLVIDAGKMARSVAPMALGYASYDEDVHVDAVIANKVGGKTHVQWIREAVEDLNYRRRRTSRNSDDSLVSTIKFAGGMVRDQSVTIPERHLGLTMPNEGNDMQSRTDRLLRLADLVEEHINIDDILELGRRRGIELFERLSATLSSSILVRTPIIRHSKRCRIGVALDEAFCFYYADNLSLLRSMGAEVVPFSPIHDDHLPHHLDGLYMGGGYPELHAEALQSNESMRRHIQSFAEAGGLIYAECGGMMYLTEGLYTGKMGDSKYSHMCGIFPDVTSRMTPHMKMHYAEIEFTANNIFAPGQICRGQKFHFSEILFDNDENDFSKRGNGSTPMKATPETVIGVQPEYVGLMYNNTVASYYHLHFASNPIIASELVRKALEFSPSQNHTAISFVSAATEIIFAIKAQSRLGGVTSLCDYPPEARCSPRRIVCRSKIDASSMTSEEVDAAMKVIKRRSEVDAANDKYSPGLWNIDDDGIKKISPKVVFVQSTCDICDPMQDDVFMALKRTGLLQEDNKSNGLKIIPVSPKTLEGVFSSINDVAIALGLSQNGVKLANELRRRLFVVGAELSKQGENTRKPSVLSLEGLSPLCTGGNWLPDIKAAAGCQDALGEKGGTKARILTWNEVLSVNPDVLILSPCSSSPQRTLDELHLLSSEPSFWKLSCVQNGEVYIIDHNRFSRPGPRLVSGVEMLASLLRGIPPPLEAEKEWENEILKYDCSVNNVIEKGISHCTTELADRFKSLFSPPILVQETETATVRKYSSLNNCVIVRSTILNYPHPEPRSAHCMITVRESSESARLSLLIFSGENRDGKRLKDAWKLSLPSKMLETNDTSVSESGLQSRFIWEYLGRSISSIADEPVPSVRSNSTATVCGSNHLLVFGGWGQDNLTPLSACELLHLETLCWTHCSTRGGIEPPPRGNPTLVYSPSNNRAILFGGWNRIKRLNDLWFLDLENWQWAQTSFDSNKDTQQGFWPKGRTDHSALLWQQNENEETMIVYGGSVEGGDAGASDELWFLDCSYKDNCRWAWDMVLIDGPCPPCRTSHAAAMIGNGKSASMIILGGTDVSRGSGKAGIVGDAWILTNLGIPESRRWIKLSWNGPGVERCRHTLNIIGSSIIVWGGWDGEETVNDTLTVWHESIHDHLPETKLSETQVAARKSAIQSKDRINGRSKLLQERWEAEIPLRREDLPPEILEKTNKSKLRNALVRAMHRYAVLNGKDTYIDPASGYSVFTQLYLKRRPCCGNGCRHCPYGHKNVPKKNTSTSKSSQSACSLNPLVTGLDW